MRPSAPHQLTDEQLYARAESMILDLQLGISSVTRANRCLDLDTVRRIRAQAAKTLGRIDTMLAQSRIDVRQARAMSERRQALSRILHEPAPIEQLARTLRVG
jgi:hypothetical protein